MHTRLILALIASWLCGLSAVATAQNRDVAVVVNSKNPVKGLTYGEVRKIFAGEKRT